MKERLEDLGRIREKLAQILDSELIEASSLHDESFVRKYTDEDEIMTLRLQLQYIVNKLYDCYAISKGEEEIE